MFLLIVGLILFVGLVVIHEFGHFIMAKRNGVEVEEFGIGFPPRVWGRKTKGGWLFSINLLPLGGFVRLKGEHDADTEKGTFGAASLWAKTKIMAAGVVLNLITAIVLLTALAWIGIPKLIENQFTVASDTKIVQSNVVIGQVDDDSPAGRAGLERGDVIAAIGPASGGSSVRLGEQIVRDDSGRTTRNNQTLSDVTKRFAGQKVTIEYKRSGDTSRTTATLRSTQEVEASKKTDDPKGYLGVYPTTYTLQRSTWSAPVVGVGLTAQFTKLTFEGLGRALGGLGAMIVGGVTGNSEARSNGQKQASEQVSGPVGIFYILKDGGVLGYEFILMIIAVISLTLAIMNILPIPALDGGRLWLTLFTRAIRRPLSQEKEELINGLGFLFLMALIVLITVVDVKRFG